MVVEKLDAMTSGISITACNAPGILRVPLELSFEYYQRRADTTRLETRTTEPFVLGETTALETLVS